MHGVFDAHIIYGFSEDNRDMMINWEWLDDNFDCISMFAVDVVRNYLGNACYGIVCNINNDTGEVIISPEDKDHVENLYKLIFKHNNISKVGYLNALSGDFCTDQHIAYDPIDSEESEESDESL